jgi:hypothetical protein
LNWLRSLPPANCPRETAAMFPRIINRLSRYWDSPAMAETVFDELLVDRRRGRKGFPAKIQAELRVLYGYYRTLHQPTPNAPEAEKRKAPSLYDRTVNAAAVRWLGELPPAVYPRETAASFPRIVNRLARFWDSPQMVAEIFDELLLDQRVGRQGFPVQVQSELRALNAFYASTRPVKSNDVWSSVPDRGLTRRK